jgi:hypothetical protein
MLRVKLSNIEGCSRGSLIYSVTQRLSYTRSQSFEAALPCTNYKKISIVKKKIINKYIYIYFFHIIRKFVSYFNHYWIENIIFSITFLILVQRGGGLTHSPLGNQLYCLTKASSNLLSLFFSDGSLSSLRRRCVIHMHSAQSWPLR